MIQPTFTVSEENKKDGHATLVLEPLDQGYGNTMGNALRRVLLSSLPGFAITSVRVRGVHHQFTTLDGLREDVVDLILNLKQVRLKSSLRDAVTLTLSVKGKKTVTAADIQTPAGVTVVNKDLYLATIEDKASLEVEMTAEPGMGYSMASDRKSPTIGVIPVDALFSPVVKVAYTVEATRVGRRTDYDKLNLQIWTDKTVEPKVALEEAAKVLVSHFKQIYNPVAPQADGGMVSPSFQSDDVLKLTVEELDLPTRIANALRKAGYKTIAELVNATRGEVARVKNLGEKSVGTVEEALNKKGLTLKD
ncbi:MAG: DNA-directed RNA polymerase subunit alpha [Candidatus Pacebacteria bacterium]|nr:DNA-directed RNA polymerase subunit alpha [Candidatus Paceibacterota bacterium]